MGTDERREAYGRQSTAATRRIREYDMYIEYCTSNIESPPYAICGEDVDGGARRRRVRGGGRRVRGEEETTLKKAENVSRVEKDLWLLVFRES